MNSGARPVLSSKWDGLSPHLLASFFEVDRDESGVWKRTDKTDPATVMAPLTEASMEVALNSGLLHLLVIRTPAYSNNID